MVLCLWQCQICHNIPDFLSGLLISLHWHILRLEFSGAQSLLRWNHFRCCSYDNIIAARCPNLQLSFNLLNLYYHLAFAILFFYIFCFYLILLIFVDIAIFIPYSTGCFTSMELLLFIRYLLGVLFSTCRWNGRAATLFDWLFFLGQHAHSWLLDGNCATVTDWIRCFPFWHNLLSHCYLL